MTLWQLDTNFGAEAPHSICGKAVELIRRDLKRRKPRKNARPDSAAEGGRSSRGGTCGSREDPQRKSAAFVLYVEGPRDLEILGYWAKRIDPALYRCIEARTVILGGKQPARAIADFSKRGGQEAGISGLIVLDRDDHGHSDHDEVRSAASRVGLEVFVWSLRHIESYLLVPDVIRRVLSLDLEDRRVEDLIRRQEAVEASQGSSGVNPVGVGEGSIHAKRILGVNGALSEVLGTEIKAGEIARAMRREELHEDVLALFGRVQRLSGIAQSGPEVEVIVRKALPASPRVLPASLKDLPASPKDVSKDTQGPVSAAGAPGESADSEQAKKDESS